MSSDDDSIGSVLSLYTILQQKYSEKNIRIIYTGEAVTRYKIFTDFNKIEWVDDVANHIAETDLLIVLDGSRYFRFSKNPEQLQTVPQKIVIDHHASPADPATLSLIEPTFSSNCELIYQLFIDSVDLTKDLTKDLAGYMLLGILGDTGNFSYVNPSQSQVFLVAKKLIETVDMPIDSFRSRYGGIPKKIFPLLQNLLKNTSYGSADGWPEYQYSFIDREVMVDGNYSDEDMSAASHIYMGQYLPRIEGYLWGFVITPRNDGTSRMSGRALTGGVNVRDFHERLGIGGGHDKASGGYFKNGDVQECLITVLDWIKTNKPAIV